MIKFSKNEEAIEYLAKQILDDRDIETLKWYIAQFRWYKDEYTELKKLTACKCNGKYCPDNAIRKDKDDTRCNKT